MYPQCSGLQGTVITVRLNSWARSRREKSRSFGVEKWYKRLKALGHITGLKFQIKHECFLGFCFGLAPSTKQQPRRKVWMLNVAKKQHSNYLNLVKVWQKRRTKLPKVSLRRYRRDLPERECFGNLIPAQATSAKSDDPQERDSRICRHAYLQWVLTHLPVRLTVTARTAPITSSNFTMAAPKTW